MNMNIGSGGLILTLPKSETSEPIEDCQVSDEVVYVTIGLDEVDSEEETEQVTGEEREPNYLTTTNEDLIEDDENTLDALDNVMVSNVFEEFKLSNLANGEKGFVREVYQTDESCTEVSQTGELMFESEVVIQDAPYEESSDVNAAAEHADVQYGTLLPDGTICLDSGKILGKRPRGRRKNGDDISYVVETENIDTPYSCTVCGKSFTRKFSAQSHLSVHLQNSAYICRICGKNFLQRCHLRDHVRGHKGEKPHTCSTCFKQFTRVSDLKRHKLLHLGYKLHSCDMCGKQFSSKHGLQYHLRIHKGIRPFPCPMCVKRYVQKSALNAHLKTHQNYVPEKSYASDDTMYAPDEIYAPGYDESENMLHIKSELDVREDIEELGYVEEIVKESEDEINEIQEEIEI